MLKKFLNSAEHWIFSGPSMQVRFEHHKQASPAIVDSLRLLSWGLLLWALWMPHVAGLWQADAQSSATAHPLWHFLEERGIVLIDTDWVRTSWLQWGLMALPWVWIHAGLQKNLTGLLLPFVHTKATALFLLLGLGCALPYGLGTAMAFFVPIAAPFALPLWICGLIVSAAACLGAYVLLIINSYQWGAITGDLLRINPLRPIKKKPLYEEDSIEQSTGELDGSAQELVFDYAKWTRVLISVALYWMFIISALSFWAIVPQVSN